MENHGRFPRVVNIRKVDLVSSVLCGREKSLSVSMKIHPIFLSFPGGILSYYLDTFAQIYLQKQYIYP
jgi:hypothetical protein